MGTKATVFCAALLLCVLVPACARDAKPQDETAVPSAASPMDGGADEATKDASGGVDSEKLEFTLVFTPGDSLLAKSVKERGGNPPYAVYSYGGDMDVLFGDERIALAEALEKNRITMDEILEKAAADLEKGIVESETYKDGGSRIYRYPDYAILKFHTRAGKEDVYIGNRELSTSGFY